MSENRKNSNTRTNNPQLKKFLYGFVAGIVIIIAGMVLKNYSESFETKAIRTEGEVISIREILNVKTGGRHKRPVIIYKSQDGNEHIFKPDLYDAPPDIYKIGDKAVLCTVFLILYVGMLTLVKK